MGCGGASRRPALMGRCPVCGRVPCGVLAGSVVLADFSFWRGDWTLGYYSMGFQNFPDIFFFLCGHLGPPQRRECRVWQLVSECRIYHIYK